MTEGLIGEGKRREPEAEPIASETRVLVFDNRRMWAANVGTTCPPTGPAAGTARCPAGRSELAPRPSHELVDANVGRKVSERNGCGSFG